MLANEALQQPAVHCRKVLYGIINLKHCQLAGSPARIFLLTHNTQLRDLLKYVLGCSPLPKADRQISLTVWRGCLSCGVLNNNIQTWFHVCKNKLVPQKADIERNITVHSIAALNLTADSLRLCSPPPCNFSFSTFCRFSEMKQKCWVRASWQAVRIYQCNPGQAQVIHGLTVGPGDLIGLFKPSWIHAFMIPFVKFYLSRLHPQMLDSYAEGKSGKKKNTHKKQVTV